ncbi:hypothetical protein [Phaeobacter inhibens]|uniref:hypothetical protein n=1 Tax=Phaeobacter inhibens TaxID=221822 RepID=UPI000C999A37|nr:hypothetical protein [Phaeobacter inhibens]AUR22555.1 hypothetical protein PhaeoP80_04532 [Phaeobacter inhibens]
MKIILILVLFNFQSGSEVITAEFDDMQACADAALRTFQGVDAAVELRPLVPAEGATLLDGTMIAYNADGAETGMYSCSPSRTENLGE